MMFTFVRSIILSLVLVVLIIKGPKVLGRD